MSLLPFLSNRQTGQSINKYNNYEFDKKISFDSHLSRLGCWSKDAYSSYGPEHYPVPPFVCKFKQDACKNILAVANEDGGILIYDTDKSALLSSNYSEHHNAIYDFCWLPQSNQMITASGDQRSYLVDVETQQLISNFRGHTKSVKTIDICKSDINIFATGSRDATICIFDRRVCSSAHEKSSVDQISCFRQRNKVNARRKGQLGLSLQECEVCAVAFQNDRFLASAGAADGVLKVWDLRKSYVKDRDHVPCYQIKFNENCSIGHGLTSLAFDACGNKLYGCCTSNKILQFDCHSYSQNIVEYNGFKCRTHFVKLALSWDDQYLLCGSSDEKAYIWKTSQPGDPILELPGHSAEVSSVAWSYYGISTIATSGDDNQVLVWKVNDAGNTGDCVNRVIYSATHASGFGKRNQQKKNTYRPDTEISISKSIPPFPCLSNFRFRTTSKSTPKTSFKTIADYLKKRVISHSKIISKRQSITSNLCEPITENTISQQEICDKANRRNSKNMKQTSILKDSAITSTGSTQDNSTHFEESVFSLKCDKLAVQSTVNSERMSIDGSINLASGLCSKDDLGEIPVSPTLTNSMDSKPLPASASTLQTTPKSLFQPITNFPTKTDPNSRVKTPSTSASLESESAKDSSATEETPEKDNESAAVQEMSTKPSPAEKENSIRLNNSAEAKRNGPLKRKKSCSSSTKLLHGTTTPRIPAKRGSKSRKTMLTSPETNSIKNYFSPLPVEK